MCTIPRPLRHVSKRAVYSVRPLSLASVQHKVSSTPDRRHTRRHIPRRVFTPRNADVSIVQLAVAAILIAACGRSDATSPNSGPVVIATDPAAAQIVTSDLAHFWAAYDAGGKNGSAGEFQSKYLDAASGGLRDFIQSRNLTASSLSQMVSAYPRYFASIRSSNLAFATDSAITARVRANFATIKSLYPPSVFPPVTLLIGRFSTGGTTSTNGMLIGSEFYSKSADTPLDELGTFQRTNVKSADSLPIIVSHEHAHILQGRANGIFTHSNKNLLEQSLIEGGADFIGEQSSGGNINAWLRPIALPMEPSLWADFKSQMHGTDVSRWLYNQGTSTATPTRPGDLGYFIGYRIVEAYYMKQADKVAALRDIIEMKDADAFLAASGYAP